MHKDFDEFCANSAKAIEKIFIRRFPSETNRPREKHSGKFLRQNCSPHKNRLQKIPLQSSGRYLGKKCRLPHVPLRHARQTALSILCFSQTVFTPYKIAAQALNFCPFRLSSLLQAVRRTSKDLQKLSTRTKAHLQTDDLRQRPAAWLQAFRQAAKIPSTISGKESAPWQRL